MAEDTLRILAVDDDQGFLADLAGMIEGQFELICARTSDQALRAVEKGGVHAVLLDLDLGHATDGYGILEKILEVEPDLPVIIVTQDTSARSAVHALKMGAADYIDKSPDLADLKLRITRALEEQRLKRQNVFLRRAIDDLKGELLGEAPIMQGLREAIGRAAPHATPVLVVGETGTGKELVARALHRLSGRKGLFVDINCAAIPKGLFESELFGSEKGAFTGADRRITGSLEVAGDGTLFLDEITEMESRLQAKLLRVIEERRHKPLGDAEPRPFTGRVVASTNRDLAKAIQDGRLREDLYYRLSAFVLEAPPLRKRVEDVPLLARHFLARAAADQKVPPHSIDAGQIARLCAYQWPGNVRELKHTMEAFAATGILVPAGERLKAACEGETGDLIHLPYEQAKAAALRRFQDRYVRAVLAAHGGDVGLAAEKMGMSRWGLQKILKQLEEPAEPAE
jgi:DNA-binding NtrC family response regulator